MENENTSHQFIIIFCRCQMSVNCYGYIATFYPTTLLPYEIFFSKNWTNETIVAWYYINNMCLKHRNNGMICMHGTLMNVFWMFCWKTKLIQNKMNKSQTKPNPTRYRFLFNKIPIHPCISFLHSKKVVLGQLGHDLVSFPKSLNHILLDLSLKKIGF